MGKIRINSYLARKKVKKGRIFEKKSGNTVAYYSRSWLQEDVAQFLLIYPNRHVEIPVEGT